MTDKKLTDEEIIQRLERCVKRGNRNYNTDIVLDLINRQKSEIERYKRYYYQHEYDKWEKQIKTKAIKEFAERLKGEIKREKESGDELLSEIYDRDVQMNSEGEKMAFDSVERIIDNILKEMVGEE